ncbi:MAG: hypothetical protein WD689_06910 [Gaiellaceae bacterium]
MTTTAIVLLVFAALVVVASVAAGIARYRAVMRRQWPEVPPLKDED